MKLSTWLEAEKGRAAAMAAHFGKTRAAISQWKTDGVPLAHMKAVREFTGGAVTLEEMVPESPAPAVEKVTRRGAKLTAPVVTPMQRGLERAGLMPHPTRGDLASPKPAVPGVVAKTAKPSGPVIVPEGVRVTVCPAGQDMRYRVDPTQPVEGGGFLAEWRARRAGGSE